MATNPLLKKFIEKGLDIDEIAELGNIFFEQGKLHPTPSEETIQRLDALEKRIGEIETFHEEQRLFMAEMRVIMEDMKPIIDNYKAATKASKWATKLIVFLSTVLGAFLTWKQLK